MRHLYKFLVKEYSQLQKELATLGFTLSGPNDKDERESLRTHTGHDEIILGHCDYRGGNSFSPDMDARAPPFYQLIWFPSSEESLPPELTEQLERILDTYNAFKPSDYASSTAPQPPS